MVRRRWLLVVVSLLVTAACVSGETWELTDSDDLGRFSVESGDTIEVTLEENPSTGYSWDPVAIPDMLALTSDEYLEPDSDLAGAPGSHVFVFEAREEGAGILRLEYIRPFDDPIVPDRVVEYILIVDDASWPPEQGDSPTGTSSATAPSP